MNKPPLDPHESRRPASASEAHELGDALEREPSKQRSASGQPTDAATHEAGARPAGESRLPHEHDEYADTPAEPRPKIVQAEADLEAGLEDTDCRNIPGVSSSRGRKGRGPCP